MIVDRYLLREVSLPFIGVSGVLLSIFLAYSLTSFLAKASGELLNPGEIARLTYLKSIIALEVLLPLGLYLGVILGLGRLYSDSEMYALQATGIGEGRLLRPIVMMAVAAAILFSLISTIARPWAYREAYDLRAISATSSELDRIKSGQFYVDNKSNRTVFVQSISNDHQKLQDIFVRSQDDRGLQVASSATGYLEPFATDDQHKLVLIDANIFKRVVNGPNVLGHFKSLTIFLGSTIAQPAGYKVKAQKTQDLRNYSDAEEKAEFQWRLLTPLSTLLLVLAAVPLSRSLPRRGRYGKAMIALLFYALYMNLITVAKTWVEQERLGSIWWLPGLFALVILLLYSPWRVYIRHRSLAKSYVDD